MKTQLIASFLFLFLFFSCSSQETYSNPEVKKIIKETEFLLLDQDFNRPDSAHQQVTIKKFDNAGRQLENMSFVGPELKFAGGLMYKYNTDGKIREEVLLDIHKNISSTEIFVYSGNKADKISISENGKKTKTATLYFDVNGNIIRKVHFYQDGSTWMEESFKYDSANKEIETVIFLNNKTKTTRYHSYDSLRRVVDRVSVDGAGKVTAREQIVYEGLTDKGDWIKRKSILNDRPHWITFQEVAYK